MDLVRILLLVFARAACFACAFVAIAMYPIDHDASAISTTIFLLSWIASGLECLLSGMYLCGLLMQNPLPHTHLRVCAVLIYIEWLIAFQTAGSGSAAIMTTKIAMSNNVHMNNYKKTMKYSIFVFAAGVFGLVSAFFNVILAKILRHPPHANHPQ
ncbi:unnamed protein product [Urochloa decumbens]|uniref:CASP-like protein n=1 Tax=Urochloa decumbens TaxID=240449 RepID=A0ABC9A094_9POAL